MWNNFQKVLEKRVSGKRVFRRDKYFIQKVVENLVLECFGRIGKENIVFDSFKKQNLYLKCKSSVWKNEVKIKEKFLLKQINQKMKEEGVFLRIIFMH